MAILVAGAPGLAAGARPVLKCKWSGTVFSEISGTETERFLSLGSGSGRCGFDGTGPYVITTMQGEGSDDYNLAPITFFDMTVHFEIRRVSDGLTKSFYQYWHGTDGYPGPVFAATSRYVTRGVRGAGVARWICCRPQDFISINWAF